MEQRGRESVAGRRVYRRAVALSALGSPIAFVLLAIAGLAAVGSVARREAADEVGKFGEVSGRVALAPFLVDELIDGDPTAYSALDGATHSFLTGGPAVRVKVWSQDGRVIYSDDPRLVGKQFELEPRDQALFASQDAYTEVSDLSKKENEFDVAGSSNRLFEVYFGAHTVSGTPVLVETYYPYNLVTTRATQLRNRFIPVMILGLGVLALIQIPLTLRLARRLSKQQTEREQLLEQVIDASTKERRRIAGEVHDGAVQELVGVSLRVAAAAEQAPPPLAASLQSSATELRTTIRSLRSLLTSIYPVEVPPGGIAAGIEDLVDDLREHHVDVVVDVRRGPIGALEEVLMLRTAREALRNVRKHACAKHVSVTVRDEDDRLVLEVADDGRGSDLDERAARRSRGHLGLQILDDIAVDAGATLRVLSQPDAGTCVRLEMAGQT